MVGERFTPARMLTLGLVDACETRLQEAVHEIRALRSLARDAEAANVLDRCPVVAAALADAESLLDAIRVMARRAAHGDEQT